ncbi:hypothetical protein [Spongorhabdus nitratireducens]
MTWHPVFDFRGMTEFSFEPGRRSNHIFTIGKEPWQLCFDFYTEADCENRIELENGLIFSAIRAYNNKTTLFTLSNINYWADESYPAAPVRLSEDQLELILNALLTFPLPLHPHQDYGYDPGGMRTKQEGFVPGKRRREWEGATVKLGNYKKVRLSHERLEAQIDILARENERLEAQNSRLKHNEEEREREYGCAVARARELEEELSHNRHRLRDQDQSYTSAKREADLLAHKLEAEQRHFDAEIRQARSRGDRYKEKVVQMASQNTQLQERILELEAELQGVRAKKRDGLPSGNTDDARVHSTTSHPDSHNSTPEASLPENSSGTVLHREIVPVSATSCALDESEVTAALSEADKRLCENMPSGFSLKMMPRDGDCFYNAVAAAYNQAVRAEPVLTGSTLRSKLALLINNLVKKIYSYQTAHKLPLHHRNHRSELESQFYQLTSSFPDQLQKRCQQGFISFSVNKCGAKQNSVDFYGDCDLLPLICVLLQVDVNAYEYEAGRAGTICHKFCLMEWLQTAHDLMPMLQELYPSPNGSRFKPVTTIHLIYNPCRLNDRDFTNAGSHFHALIPSSSPAVIPPPSVKPVGYDLDFPPLDSKKDFQPAGSGEWKSVKRRSRRRAH